MQWRRSAATVAAVLLGICLICSGCTSLFEKTGEGVWPDSRLLSGVPKPQFDYHISQSFDEDGEVGILFDNVTPEQAAEYLQTLKDAGYTITESSSEVDGSVSYVALREDSKRHMAYTYEKDEKRMSVFFDEYIRLDDEEESN